MKRVLVIGLLFLFLALPVFADSDYATSVSVSDAVYADLAVRHYLDNVSIVYKDGQADHDVNLNETRHWIPASTVKTFAAMYAYKLAAEKKLNLNNKVIIDTKNDVPTELVTDEMPTLMEGDLVTIDRLLRQMITQSDNTAFNVLLDVLGRDKITSYIQSLGLSHSRIGSKLNLDTSQEQYEFDVPGYGINTTTAEDYAKAFTLIKENKIPGAKNLFSVLKKQKINIMIPRLLPKDVVCAHKTGDLDPLYHDGGVCQDKKQSYVITIFSNAGNPNLLAHLSKLIYTKDYNFVGEDLDNKPFGQDIQENHPLDPLVMALPAPNVLGANTDNYQVPSITAADLGVTAQDLSLVIKDKELPPVIIPSDSPFHFLSELVQIAARAIVLDPKAKLNMDFDQAKLRMAEAKDLEKRGKTQEARIVLQSIQRGLTIITKDAALVHDSSAQNTVEAISETRFSILAHEVKKAKGGEKLALIREIAFQAKDTLKNVQPNIPDATNATNPSQKPLIGEVVDTTLNKVTVKTAGGQEVTIPANNNSIIVKDKRLVPTVSPLPSAPLSALVKGTTVALVGSTTNNVFYPTLILANIPKELGAPEPVTVAKVDIKNNTMVVVENGVYTQVNINKNTSIKGDDTNIPLKAIKPGDVVVVHGEPLTPVIPKAQSTISVTSGPKNTVTPSKTIKSFEKPQTSTVPSNSVISPSPIPSTTVQKNQLQPQQPMVIQSTSVQLIEKKEDVVKASASSPSQPKLEQKPQPQNSAPQPKSQPQTVKSNPPAVKSDEKKK